VTITGTPVRDALDSALIALRAAGVGQPRLDAEVLLAHALGVDRARLLIDRDIVVDGAAGRWFRDAIRRRTVQRAPVAYLIGSRGFRGIDLMVDPRVLIPRPETEHLVEAALGLPNGARAHEVGTGSGAVALALKSERPDLVVSASDISADALDVARANGRRLDLDVAFTQADMLSGVRQGDAVIANLPYVADADELPPDVVLHEPSLALRGGDDGLDAFRALAAQLVAPWVALEVGAGQAAAVCALFADRSTRVEDDLSGIGRVVVAWRG
jgi:release factor glutamine methyltransferase